MPECLDDWIDESNPVRVMSDVTDFTKLSEEELAVIFAEHRAKLKALRKASFRKWAASEGESLYRDL